MQIPDKLYFRVGEVASLCGVPAYVLRFWESEFPQLRPSKSGAGQRLYRQRDVELVLRIKHLLYEGKFTIAGARQQLKSEHRGAGPQLSLVLTERQRLTESERPVPVDPRAMRKLQREMMDLLHLLGPKVEPSKLQPSNPQPPPAAPPAIPSAPLETPAPAPGSFFEQD